MQLTPMGNSNGVIKWLASPEEGEQVDAIKIRTTFVQMFPGKSIEVTARQGGSFEIGFPDGIDEDEEVRRKLYCTIITTCVDSVQDAPAPA